jgi:hypothetical protein
MRFIRGRLALRAQQLFRGDHETWQPGACNVAPPERVGSSARERDFDVLGSPCGVCLDRAHACSMQTIDQNVGPTLADDFRDRKPGRWHPQQRNREIARPNPPRRAVLKFDNIALLVFLDAHTIPPVFGMRIIRLNRAAENTVSTAKNVSNNRVRSGHRHLPPGPETGLHERGRC